MTTEPHILTVSGLEVSVVRKPIKNLHLGVYPPDGRVRVVAPLAVSDAAVRAAVIGKLRWIRRQRSAFEEQARQSEREMVSGESHYYLGRRMRLDLVVTEGRNRVALRGNTVLELHARPALSSEQRSALLQRWYRQRLRELAGPIIERWQDALGVSVAFWGIKRMKTKWGACNPDSRRVWLNLELVKKPPECLEYIVVHELVHLLERKHNDRFVALMDRHLPNWQATRTTLNATPLGHELWEY